MNPALQSQVPRSTTFQNSLDENELRKLEKTEVCLHCNQPLSNFRKDHFCCAGCKWVYSLLHKQGLTRFYELRTRKVAASEAFQKTHLSPWMQNIVHQVEQINEDLHPNGKYFSFDIQNLQCAACVWLIESLFRKNIGSKNIQINSALGRIEIQVTHAFAMAKWLLDVESFGYKLGPSEKTISKKRHDLIFQMGVCVALAANVMLFSIAHYLGLSSGPVHTFFSQISYAASFLSVIIGGSVFIRSAVQGLRNRVIHLDLPIAIGIVLAFAGSSWSFFNHNTSALYLDTVSVFIALMLVGRVLQSRLLQANQNRIHASPHFEKILVRRIRDDQVEIVPCAQVEKGDELLIAPGDLVPVDAILLEEKGIFSMDWIDGESTPRPIAFQNNIVAGAFNASSHALRLRAASSAKEASLANLLKEHRAATPQTDSQLHEGMAHQGPMQSAWWSKISLFYTALVLVSASAGFVYWYFLHQDVTKALEVTVAILVVTCPCAFGIAVPLAYELVYSSLSRNGFFVRSSSFFDRALSIEKIVFDKTGTLTTGSLLLTNEKSLEELSLHLQTVLYNMVACSNHPKSAALLEALENQSSKFINPLTLSTHYQVQEEIGKGTILQDGQDEYRLGNPSWALSMDHIVHPQALLFTKNGKPLATFDLEEQIRPAAKQELALLEKDGFEISILSGDHSQKVNEVSRKLGIPLDKAIAEKTPQQKAEWVRVNSPKQTLMIGDGVNDRLASFEAVCSGTPSISRPFLASQCDFYFTTPGLFPIRYALALSKKLRRVIRADFAIAIVYNLAAISLAFSGWMKPWLAAVLMPSSSVLTILFTTLSLSINSENNTHKKEISQPWKS